MNRIIFYVFLFFLLLSSLCCSQDTTEKGEILAKITQAPTSEVTPLLQKVYSEPIKEKLVGQRIQEIKQAGAICAVSATPANTKLLAPIASEAQADIFVVQSTVTSARHMSKSQRGLIFSELCKSVPMPIVVGNFETGKSRALLRDCQNYGIAACSRFEPDPYLTADNRYVIYNASPFGTMQVFAAEIPTDFLTSLD